MSYSFSVCRIMKRDLGHCTYAYTFNCTYIYIYAHIHLLSLQEKGEKAAEKVERKRRKKEATKDSPKESQGKGRGRGRGRGKGCGKGRKRKEPDEEEGVHIQKISGKGKGKGKRKVTKKPSKLISDCGETPVKRTRRTWKPSPMAVKTSKVASAADERLNKAKAALEELISRMEKGGNPYAYAFEPPPKGFLKKNLACEILSLLLFCGVRISGKNGPMLVASCPHISYTKELHYQARSCAWRSSSHYHRCGTLQPKLLHQPCG